VKRSVTPGAYERHGATSCRRGTLVLRERCLTRHTLRALDPCYRSDVLGHAVRDPRPETPTRRRVRVLWPRLRFGPTSRWDHSSLHQSSRTGGVALSSRGHGRSNPQLMVAQGIEYLKANAEAWEARREDQLRVASEPHTAKKGERQVSASR
jgi:hypothetical protein